MNRLPQARQAFRAAAGLLLALLAALGPAAAQPGGECAYAAPVCAVRASVFHVAAYGLDANAVRIGDGLLVTNRHVVADEEDVVVFLADGSQIPGKVVPASYAGDLVLIEAKLPDGPVIALDEDADKGPWQTVAASADFRFVRVYPPGGPLALPAEDRPLARIHHTAQSQFGASGGALVDREGELVGIVASGGEGRGEAIPARAIAELRAASGAAHAEESRRIGTAHRDCDWALDKARQVGRGLPEPLAATLEARCLAGGNKLQIELAAQALGRAGLLDRSAELFERALSQDPEAINTRLGYLTTLHLSARFADEVPIIRDLIELIPEDDQLQRYAVQAGKWGGDMELAEEGARLVEQYNPAQGEAVRRFLQAEMPPPRRQPPPP
ncbi:MAG: trypsin-like peptidase domain-containing protein [Hyphomicrobiales bacterium]|nr:trypsin-like peptidase domain-containing protein [Hyphomicrobiales bacterium]